MSISHEEPEVGAALRAHLQYAVDLELWTIPFYMAALYSIRDPSTRAYQLVQSIVFQEMLHLQLAANLANALGVTPTFAAPTYRGTHIPHLDFRLDKPNPTEKFTPYSAEIGPFDELRINAMCLIEYPEWRSDAPVAMKANVSEYGSIGEMYDALEAGVAENARDIRGNRHQVDHFRRFYNHLSTLTITADGQSGLSQAQVLIDTIREQGEGTRPAPRPAGIPTAFRNTADDPRPAQAHFAKFVTLRSARPATWPAEARPAPGTRGHKCQEILVANFADLLSTLQRTFSGGDASDFGAVMATAGASIGNCWKNGAIPRFS